MTNYIEIELTDYTFNEIIEGLEKLCELSNDYMEIENYFCLIKNLNMQKNEYYDKENEEFQREFKIGKYKEE